MKTPLICTQGMHRFVHFNEIIRILSRSGKQITERMLVFSLLDAFEAPGNEAEAGSSWSFAA